MGRTLKVLHYGLGPIGQGVARLVLETPGLKIVGATDVSSDVAGRDLGALLGLPGKLRVKVDGTPERLLDRVEADVAVLCTSSSLAEVAAPIEELLRRGLNVVTTCEELAFPLPSAARAAHALDELARRRHVSLLATGINPGYAMDALALALTAPCSGVKRVSVTRVVDAGTRRLALQRKVGAGLTLPQFRRAQTDGAVRHVGLLQSAHMLAAGLGFQLEKVEETLDPAVAPRDLETEYLRVPAGCASGLKQVARGYAGGELVVSLDLQMYVGASPQRDHVLVDATPTIDMTIAGGIPGDGAAAALVVNCIPKLMAARPGLLTMRDLPLVHSFNPHELGALPPRKR